MMKQYIFKFLVIVTAINCNHISAQVDKSSGGSVKGTSIGTIAAPAREIKKPKTLGFGNNNGFKTANKELEKKRRKKNAEEDLKNKGIITPALLRKITLQKKAEKFNFEIPMIDKDIGSFTTKSKHINIRAFDYGQIDGDIISIYKNGKPIVENYTLKKDLDFFKIPINHGFNKIEILAIHEGKLRPNTGAFTIYDDYNEIVVSDLWSLAKGAKVIAHIIRLKQ